MVDIKPKGFYAIELNGYVTDAAVRQTRQILEDAELRKKMVDQNYEIAKEFFSYAILRHNIKSFLEEPASVLKHFNYY